MFFSSLGQPRLRFVKHSNLSNLVDESMSHVVVASCCSSMLHQFLWEANLTNRVTRAIFSWNGLMYIKTSASLKVFFRTETVGKCARITPPELFFVTEILSFAREFQKKSLNFGSPLYSQHTQASWSVFVCSLFCRNFLLYFCFVRFAAASNCTSLTWRLELSTESRGPADDLHLHQLQSSFFNQIPELSILSAARFPLKTI